MTRYLFHCANGAHQFDAEGVELEDLHAAHQEAIRCMGELLTNLPPDFWSKGSLAIFVTDAALNLLFSITTMATAPLGLPDLLDTPS